MRGSKSIWLTIARGSCGSRSMVLDSTFVAIKIPRIPPINTLVARLGVRKNRWRIRMVKKDIQMAGSLGSGLLK